MQIKEFDNKNLDLASLEEMSSVLNEIKDVYLFSLNHKTAPIPIREKFAVPEYKLQEAVQHLKASKVFNSFLLLSTCNRTEFYFRTDDFDKAYEELSNFFTDFLKLEHKISKEYGIVSNGIEVIDHAYDLSGGLDSLIIGERQVLSQIKYAYNIAQSEKTLDNLFEKLFQSILNTGKRIHSETGISKGCQSISSATVDLINKYYGSLKTKNVMILGAGRMAVLALERIEELGGTNETFVLNRSPHKIIEFEEKYKIDNAFPFEKVYEVINDVDVIICAAGAPHYILFAEKFKEARKDKKKELTIFDIALPRNIDSEFGKTQNVNLIDIVGLQSMYNSNFKVSESDIDDSKGIIKTEKKDFYNFLKNKEVSELIAKLKEKTHLNRKEKLTKLTAGKETLTVEEVEYITKNILDSFLHEPITNLKSSSSGEHILKEIFSVD